MDSNISRIGPHVYVKGSVEAVKLYKKAFGLKNKGKPVLDSKGDIYYTCLTKNGEFFMSVSEDKYLQTALINENTADVQPVMVFTVAFENEDNLRKIYDLLYENGSPSTGLIVQPSASIYCDLIDKFGVCWCLFVPDNWDNRVVPK
jgi:PhnB protein